MDKIDIILANQFILWGLSVISVTFTKLLYEFVIPDYFIFDFFKTFTILLMIWLILIVFATGIKMIWEFIKQFN